MDPITIGLAGAGFLKGLLGNRTQKQYSFQRGNNNTTNYSLNQGTQANYNKAMPVWDPATIGLRDKLLGTGSDLLSPGQYIDPKTFADSYTTEGIRQLNNQGSLQNKVIQNVMRQRGLNYSPAMGTAMANAEAGRVGQAFSLLNQRPMIQQQQEDRIAGLQQNRIALANQILASMPKGSENEGFTNTANVNEGNTQSDYQSYGEQTQPGNPWGGAFGGLADMLGYIYGLNKQFPNSGGGASVIPGMSPQSIQIPNVYQPSNQVPTQQLPSWLQPNYGMQGINPNYSLPYIPLYQAYGGRP